MIRRVPLIGLIAMSVSVAGLLVGCKTTASPDVRAELDDVYQAYVDVCSTVDVEVFPFVRRISEIPCVVSRRVEVGIDGDACEV